MKTTIDRLGRVGVPKEFREKLGLRPGSEILIDQKDREIIKEAVQAVPLQDENGVLVFAGTATGDIVSGVQRQRRKRRQKLSADSM